MFEGDFFSGLYTSIRGRLFLFLDFIYTIFAYWRDFRFFKIDFSVLKNYFWKSPYRIVRELSLGTYGETPLKTMAKIAKELELTKDDHFIEMGSGRGRCALWLSHFIGCSVLGIELIPKFVKVAKGVVEEYDLKNCYFSCEDYFDTDVSNASHIYLYDPGLTESSIHNLTMLLKKASPGTKIITVSFSLGEYFPEKEWFSVEKEFSVSFPWGKTTAYIQKRSNS